MTSNLPPGVSVSMIPGCRPEDEAWERWIEGAPDNWTIAAALADSLDLPPLPLLYGNESPAWLLKKKLVEWLGQLDGQHVTTVAVHAGVYPSLDEWLGQFAPDPDEWP